MNSRRVVVVSFVALLGASAALLSAAERAERPWIDQVERDRDRGAGRIVDEPAWETSRIQEDRDVRLGRLEPRRDFDRFDEERDRRLRLDARSRAAAPSGVRADGSVILSQPS